MQGERPEQRLEISLTEMRSLARSAAADVLEPRDPSAAVELLWRVGMAGADDWRLAEGLWHIWASIASELKEHPGPGADTARLARECALDFLEAVGDDDLERAYCDRWMGNRPTTVSSTPRQGDSASPARAARTPFD